MSSVESPLVERIKRTSRRPKNLGQAPRGAVSLAMGEPDGDTAPAVVEAAIASLRAGRTHYAPLTGSNELRAAIAAFVSDGTGRVTSPEEVVITHGASAGIAATMLALVRPGDRVLIPEPTYSLYADHLAMVGAEVVWVPNLADGSVDFARIEELAGGARMVILCNPSNPTGQILTTDQMDVMAGIVARHPGLLLVSDEAYSEIVYDGLPYASGLALAGIRDQVVMLGTFSKAYAMTGWRLGYVIAPAPLADPVNLVHRTINGSINTFVQDAAIEALKTPASDLAAMREQYQRRRDIVVAALAAMPKVSVHTPTGAFYAFPKIDSPLTSQELVDALAAGGVLVRSGAEFGPSGEGHVRISFATDEESLAEGMRRFATVVATL
ncbi:MAG: pyridoxal phosphate-dependent aminotransferase [Propioniciclava sp.]|uniref:pyridoxal phosphate-dependent aminotransferase n=1 Tax=Propioniciclava sp. TaxID=2038686 RepID=UPI0039E26A37